MSSTNEDNVDYPLRNIAQPGSHDVMCGRGGGTNNHSGNIRFRKLVNEHKLRYLAASKVDKPKVAREVVQIWRQQSPSGRFLSRTTAELAAKTKDVMWHDVGDQKAREKASQCLRERTPDVIPFVNRLQNQQRSSKELSSRKKDIKNAKICAKRKRKLNSADTPCTVPSAPTNPSDQVMDEKTAEEIVKYFKNASINTSVNDNEVESIDPSGTASEIAAALFRNCKYDEESVTQILKATQGRGKAQDRSELVEILSRTSWMQSFDSIDPDMLSANSLGEIEKKHAEEVMKCATSRRTMLSKTNSKHSVISELTELECAVDDMSTCSSYLNRGLLKGMRRGSNISMMSELTDVTGGFTHMSIKESDD